MVRTKRFRCVNGHMRQVTLRAALERYFAADTAGTDCNTRDLCAAYSYRTSPGFHGTRDISHPATGLSALLVSTGSARWWRTSTPVRHSAPPLAPDS